MDKALIEKIVSDIREHAAREKVLYLASGGSSISVSVEILNQLDETVRSALTLSLTDERYGAVGHSDSNWQQLLDVGLRTEGMTLLPVLDNQCATREETTEHFRVALEQALTPKPYVIALFGVGSDSHIAGLLPESSAVKEESLLVASYSAPPYERISIAPQAFRRIDSGYIYARGEGKRAAVEGLAQDLPYVSHPNQLIKRCKKHLVSFNQ